MDTATSGSTPSSRHEAAVPPPADSSGCPTPLDWRSVIAEYRAEQTETRFAVGRGVVPVRSFGSGSALLWLTGAAGNSDLLALSHWLLRDDHQSLVISTADLQSAATRPRDVASVVSVLAEFLNRLGLTGSELIGVGSGGLIGLRAAVDAPELIRTLALQGTAPGVDWTLSERALLAIGRHWPGPLRRVPVWNRAATLNHAPWFPPFDPSRWEFLRDNLGETSVRQFALAMQLMQASWDGVDWGALAARVLWIATEGESPGVARAREHWAQMLPQVHVEEMHSCGQFPYLTHPHRFVKLLREFLAHPAEEPHSPPATTGELES